jgi:ribose transport system substrate-binding protein
MSEAFRSFLSNRKPIFAGFLAVVLVACDGSGQADRTANKALLVLKTQDNEFFDQIRRGFEAGLDKKFSPITRSGKSETDVGGQQAVLSAFRSSNAELKSLVGVAITPSSSGTELLQDLIALNKAGILTILIDTIIDPKNFKDRGGVFNVGYQSDNQQGGRLAAKFLLERLELAAPAKSTLSILVLEGAVSSDTAHQRRNGFLDEVRKSDSRQKIRIESRVADWRRDQALTIVSSYLHTEQIPDAIFAANDQMALGAVRAYEVSNRRRPLIVGFDAIPEAIAAIKSGRLDATVAQDAVEMGRRAAIALNLRDETKAKEFSVDYVPVKLCSPECQ